MSLRKAKIAFASQNMSLRFDPVEEDKMISCDLPNLGGSDLHGLCKKRDPEPVRAFLESFKSSVDIVDPESGVTPLVTACKFGNLKIVKILMQRGANVNHSCSGLNREEIKYDGITPIYVAAEAGHASIVEYLGDHGADVNVQMSPLGLTPLHRALFKRHKDVMSVLIDKFNAKVNLPCNDIPGAYPLYNAVFLDASLLEILLRAGDADPNVPDPSEQITPLHMAAYVGALSAAEILVLHGADVNVQLKYGHSPLDIAIQEKHRHLADFLRLHDARRKILDKSWHPFSLCVVSGMQSLKTAVKRGADVNFLISSKSGTALHFSICSHRMDLFKFLISHGADIERTDVRGKTPLHTAVEGGMTPFVEFLLEKGANINAQTSVGFTPLLKAVMLGNLTMCKFLIRKGADLELTANQLGTPLMVAVLQGHTSIVDFLLMSGANPSAQNIDHSGKPTTIFHVAVKFVSHKPEIMKALIKAGADITVPMPSHYGIFSVLQVFLVFSQSEECLKLLIESGAFLDSHETITDTDDSYVSSVQVSTDRGLQPPNVTTMDYAANSSQKLYDLLYNTVNLFKAVRTDDIEAAKKYLALGGLVNCCSVRFDTPLMYASSKGFVDMVKFLLRNGAKIDFINFSPLHRAARYNHKKVAIELIKAGASLDVVQNGKTPLELAQEHNQSDVIDILEFVKKYRIEFRSDKLSLVDNWNSDPTIADLASELLGMTIEEDLDALFKD